MQKESSDEKLVILSLQDSSNFAHLIDRYENKLSRYIKRLLNVSEQDTEDILQEIFIKTYRSLNAFDTSLSFSNWIYRIAHNEAISHYRKERRRNGNISIDAEENKYLENLLRDSLDIQKEIEEKELVEKIREMIDSLPRNYRDVIILHYFEDKSYEEMSDILQKPEGTIATLLSRAKKMLKEMKNNYNLESYLQKP
jgi:RNA polymerase sigma-70 factor (ECF subfamily)